MSEDDDDSSKTEEPSHKKLEDARKKGNLVSTRELNHFFMMGAIIFFLASMAPHLGSQVLELVAPFITRPESYEVTQSTIVETLNRLIMQAGLLLATTLLLTFAAALAPSLLQGKWVFSTDSMKPKFSKLSPLAGIKRLLGKKAIVEFLKNLIKISIVGIATVMVVLPYAHQLPGLVTIDNTFSLAFAGKMAARMLTATCMFLFLLSIIDYLYQRFIFMKSQRMTKQEVKDEYKQQEGDPHHKQKLRQIRAERARKRMMANVPKADVIITNPTHYAIALKYDPKKMAVPKLIAKGTDEVALRIRELAQTHKITIVRNPPLARVLYDTADIDDDIPAQHYQAVAKIIGYVYKLKGKKPQGPKKPIGPSYSGKKPKK